MKAQYHMKRRYDQLPSQNNTTFLVGARHVGLIGCGSFGYSVIAYYLCKKLGDVIKTAVDIDKNRAISLSRDYKVPNYSVDGEDIIKDREIDLVFIASNHASHAEYGIQCLNTGKHVHIEKPHVVSLDQLMRLCATMKQTSGHVALGFNRPHSRLGRMAKVALDSQSGPAMMSWFIAGHAIDPGHWYFHKDEGGRILGNLCHWTDFTLRMVPEAGRYPIKITPTRWEKADSDIAVSYLFGDGTIATLAFSAKGHVFEGVRERFAAHKADVLLTLDDFTKLRIDTVDRVQQRRLLFRDHGHEDRILSSYRLCGRTGGPVEPCSVKYVWETGELFLRTREALESQKIIVVEPYDERRMLGQER